MKKAAIYIRVSTVDQATEGYSLEAQEHALRKWCEQQHYEPVLYADCGISAKDIIHRPDMLRMMRDAENKAFSAIVVWSLSRLTRSVLDLYSVWSVLQKSDIALYSATESFDTNTPMGRAAMGMLGIFAQMEREFTSERVKLAISERLNNGMPLQSEILGYKRKAESFVVVPEEADLVKRIYRMYAEFGCFRTVASELRRAGYVGKRGRAPREESVARILSRPFYCGFITYKGVLVARGRHEPIISVEDYNQVQNLILANGEHCGRKRKRQLILLPETEEN